MSVLDSHNNLIANAQAYGMANSFTTHEITASTTAATVNCGFQTAQRYPRNFNLIGQTGTATLGGGVTGGYATYLRPYCSVGNTHTIVGIEYQLGQITANGGTGTFVDGSAMPTKSFRIGGASSSLQTSAMLVFASVSTVMVGAGTYTLTITYVNQDGTGSRTATLTIPNIAAVNSAFDVIPHLQAGDTGIQDITNITLTGTSGVIRIYGLLPLGYSTNTTSSAYACFSDPLALPMPMYLIEAADTLAVYTMGTNAVKTCMVIMGVVAET
jgi:hypothetical protein